MHPPSAAGSQLRKSSKGPTALLECCYSDTTHTVWGTSFLWQSLVHPRATDSGLRRTTRGSGGTSRRWGSPGHQRQILVSHIKASVVSSLHHQASGVGEQHKRSGLHRHWPASGD